MMGTMAGAAVGAVAGTMAGSAIAGAMGGGDKEAEAKKAKEEEAKKAEAEAAALQKKLDEAKAKAEAARAAVRTFLLRNKRLPCPDLSSNGTGGREGLAGSCPNGAQLGWLPYESLGLPPPQPSQRMRYAASRLGAGADLVAPPDLGVADFDGVARLRGALSRAAKLGLGSDRPYLTGVGSAADPENCSHIVANPAFALIAPVADRDDVGSTHPGFDGINRAMADASAHCIAAPGRAMDATYDDVVLAESASALLGWLATTTR